MSEPTQQDRERAKGFAEDVTDANGHMAWGSTGGDILNMARTLLALLAEREAMATRIEQLTREMNSNGNLAAALVIERDSMRVARDTAFARGRRTGLLELAEFVDERAKYLDCEMIASHARAMAEKEPST